MSDYGKESIDCARGASRTGARCDMSYKERDDVRFSDYGDRKPNSPRVTPGMQRSDELEIG